MRMLEGGCGGVFFFISNTHNCFFWASCVYLNLNLQALGAPRLRVRLEAPAGLL